MVNSNKIFIGTEYLITEVPNNEIKTKIEQPEVINIEALKYLVKISKFQNA